jgi:exopolysaccharide biosynthesis polyprenyl glycosylphosphotransferase
MSAPARTPADRDVLRAAASESTMPSSLGMPARMMTSQGATAPLPLAAPAQPQLEDAQAQLAERTRPRRAATLLQWLLEGRGWDLLRPGVDLVAATIATVIALGGATATLNVSSQRAPLLALPLLIVALLYLRGLYRSRLRALILDSMVPVGGAVSVAAMAVIALGLFANGRPPQEAESLRAWGLALGAVALGRMALALAQRWARAHRLIGSPVLILGAGVVGSQMAQRLENHPEYGLRPVGFLDDDPRAPTDAAPRDVPVVGTVEDLDQIVARTGVGHLIVAFSSATDSRVSPLIQSCQALGMDVSVVPRMFDTINDRVGYETVGGLPLLSFSNVRPNGFQFALKHAFDRIVAALLLIVLAPVMLGVALAVRLSSPGPALFRQRRVGRDGKLFDLYKFRSMRMSEPRAVAEGCAAAEPVPGTGQQASGGHVLEAEAAKATGASAGADAGPGASAGAGAGRSDGAGAGRSDGAGADATLRWLGRDIAPGGVEGEDRRTTIGQVIRRTALDELPQLFNVLRGEMSLVGPRPERPEFVELFRQEVARYGDRHRVKSGITGWAQVHGLRGKTSLGERVEWDNYYIAHWSLGLDLKILLLTFLALFRGGE